MRKPGHITLLTEKGVNIIMDSCLCTQDELKYKDCPITTVEGITSTTLYSFHTERIASHILHLKDMIQQLSPAFNARYGGKTFLAMTETKHGEIWGGYAAAEALVILAIAANLCQISGSRSMWDILPGKRPFVMFKESAYG